MNIQSVGDEYEILNISLPAATDTAITLTRAVKSFVIQNRSLTDMELRRNSGDSTFWTIKAGGSFSADVTRSRRVISTTIGFLRTAGATTAEVLVTY